MQQYALLSVSVYGKICMGVIKVDSLPKGYTILFNGITDALTALSEQNFGTAEAILIQAQQRAEDAYLDDGE